LADVYSLLRHKHCFEFVSDPLDRVVELFTALRELQYRKLRLFVDLRADFGAHQRTGDRGLLVAAQ
jgi:hypothetical protein